MKSKSTLIFIEALLAVIAWGASFVATKVALHDAQPLTVIWLRFGMGVLILAPTVAFRKEWAFPKPRDLLLFAALGLQGITFHQWIQSTALLTAQAITAAWIVTTAPVFIAILGTLFLRERLGWFRAGGIALAATGVSLVVSKGNLTSLFTGWTQGEFFMLISAFNWAVFSVLSRGFLRGHPPGRMMLYVMAFGWLFTTVLFLPGPGLSDMSHLTLNGWLGVLFLGIFCSALAYIFWYDALGALPASQVGAFLYLEPLVTMVIATIVLSEQIVWTAVVGGLVIILGVWMVNH